MTAKILVVEDEQLIAEMIQFNLEKQGYEVYVAPDGILAVQKVEQVKPDLILLDIMLPGLNGFEVCRQVRKNHNTPIIMLTAKETESDKVQGLNLGADDYITKPFNPQELLARVNAQLRRANVLNVQELNNVNQLNFGKLKIDIEKYEVYKSDNLLALTIREFELLSFLAKNADKVYSRADLLHEVWGYKEFFGDDRTVDVTVRRLREKIEEIPSAPQYIITKRGVGYYFRRK